MSRIGKATLLLSLLLGLSITGWALFSSLKQETPTTYSLPEHPAFSGPVSTRISF